MKPRIGIFTALGSLQNLKKADCAMRELGEITYLPYSSLMEMVNLYMENVKNYDGFLFCGSFPYEYITENLGPIDIPNRYVEVTERDYYLLIARLYSENPSINFNRVIFDAQINDPQNGQEFSALEDIFSPDKMPQIRMIMDYSFYNQNFQTIYEAGMNAYREAWRSGKTDLIVTRLTNLARQMEQEGIPHTLFLPCPATIMEHFRALLHDIEKNRMEKSLVACCVIQIAGKESGPEDMEILKRALNQFNSEQNKVFVLRQNDSVFDAVTSSETVRKLTAEYTTCRLTSFLYEVLPFSTYIGWGVGYDLVTAHKSALRAIHESLNDANRYTYLVNENEEMVGPLRGDRTISYQLKPNARTNRIAKVLGISPINLEKLISLQVNRNMTEFSASDLVFYLDITPRSATRILKKLTDYGAAIQVNRLNLNGRGRPAAIYEIDFDKIQL